MDGFLNKHSSTIKNFSCDLDERISACSYGEKSLNIGMNQKEKHTLESSEYQKPKPTIKMKKFSKEYPCKSLKRSIATLMEEIKIVVSEKHEFEYREESILIAYFEIFGLAGF